MALPTGVAVCFYAKRPTVTALLVAVLACASLPVIAAATRIDELPALEVGLLRLLPGAPHGPVAHSHTDESRGLSVLHLIGDLIHDGRLERQGGCTQGCDRR
jgi:hypothetical protein